MDEDARPMEETESLGQRITHSRTHRGMTLVKVVRADFSRSFLNQVEMGKARPSIRLLHVIAERLGTEVEHLRAGHEAGVERELALEKGRVLLLQGEPRRALLALKPALNSYDWPLGSDARVCQAQALISLGRKEQAAQILAHERQEIELHNDRHRIERLNTVERGQEVRCPGYAVQAPQLL